MAPLYIDVAGPINSVAVTVPGTTKFPEELVTKTCCQLAIPPDVAADVLTYKLPLVTDV